MANIPQTPYDPNEDEAIPLKYFSTRHATCIFLLDTSKSMYGEPIANLNAYINNFKETVLNDPRLDDRTKSCIDVALVTFGSEVKVIQDFVPAEKMAVPILKAEGHSCMGAALEKAMDMIADRKMLYNEYGVPYAKPWIYCITDGEPTDNYLEAAKRLEKLENERKVLACCLVANDSCKNPVAFEIMRQIFAPERIFELEDCDFSDFFRELNYYPDFEVRNDFEGAIEVDAPKKLKIAF